MRTAWVGLLALAVATVATPRAADAHVAVAIGLPGFGFFFGAPYAATGVYVAPPVYAAPPVAYGPPAVAYPVPPVYYGGPAYYPYARPVYYRPAYYRGWSYRGYYGHPHGWH